MLPPPNAPLVSEPKTVRTVPSPALAAFTNSIIPLLPPTEGATVRFCVTPELLLIPGPLMVNVTPVETGSGSAVMLKLLAPGLNTISATSVITAENLRPVTLDPAKVATSVGPFGTVAGVQLTAVFQSPVVGLRFQVALPARASRMKAEVRIKKTTSLVFIELVKEQPLG